jgi:hypothetical protein
MSDLLSVHVRDGIFIPRGIISKDDVVYDSAGNLVPASCLYGIPGSDGTGLQLHPSDAPSRLPENMMSCRRSDETSVVFLGMFDILHYGHWLTDGLSRFWYLLDNSSNNRFVMSWDIKRRIKHIRDLRLSLGLPYWPAALAAFGLKASQFCRVSKPTRFAEIIIPYPSQYLNVPIHLYDNPQIRFPHPCHYQVTRKIAESVTSGLNDSKGGRIVYVSRSRLKRGAIMNEVPVEDFCRSRGVEIVHPQFLTLAEKIQKISEADVVIGRPGTSFANLLFRRNQASAQCIYLGGSQDQLMNDLVSISTGCDAAVGRKSTVIDCLMRLDGDTKKSLVCDVDKAIAGLKQVLG